MESAFRSALLRRELASPVQNPIVCPAIQDAAMFSALSHCAVAIAMGISVRFSTPSLKVCCADKTSLKPMR
jgi:hypothetical protein